MYLLRGNYLINLRPYQTECLASIASNRNDGILRQIVHLPTAAGKTVVFGSLIAEAIKADPSSRVLILAFNCDLLGQAKDKIKMIDPSIDVGILDAFNKEFNCQVVVSSVQSARQPGNLEQLRKQGFSICIADECHHFASDSARFVLNELGFSKEGCAKGGHLLCGFSATPYRQDDKGLGEVFDKIVYHKSIAEMVRDGYLSPPRGHKVLTDLDLSKVAIENGDYSITALSQLMNTAVINEMIVQSYLEKAAGRKAIAFATSIAHAVALADCFRRFGVRAEAIHSNLSFDERESLKKQFREGEIEVLTNPLMLTEGYDEPSISAVVVARPTKSLGLYQQMIGRGLRPSVQKKDCVVLDFGDQAHSLCNVDVLLGGDVDEKKEEKRPRNERIEELVKKLPTNLNPKLKKAILEIDLLGNSFSWQKDADGCYFLKGGGETVIKLIKTSEDLFDAILFSKGGAQTIASALDFEYSFSSAEDFARANKGLFAVSDLDAPWRSLPISERQKELFRSGGFKIGIDSLNRGQAATIIGSGILRRRKIARNRRLNKDFVKVKQTE